MFTYSLVNRLMELAAFGCNSGLQGSKLGYLMTWGSDEKWSILACSRPLMTSQNFRNWIKGYQRNILIFIGTTEPLFKWQKPGFPHDFPPISRGATRLCRISSRSPTAWSGARWPPKFEGNAVVNLMVLSCFIDVYPPQWMFNHSSMVNPFPFKRVFWN